MGIVQTIARSGRDSQGNWGPLPLDADAARIAQGLPNVGAAAANAATGGKLGVAKSAMSAAAPVAGAIAQGAGFQIGFGGVKGIFNLILNMLRNLWPEFGTDRGYFGLYIWFIIFVYYWSWLAGFAASAVLSSHTTLAVIGFIFSVKVDGLSFQTVRRYGIVFSVLLLIDYMLLTGSIHWYLLLIAALLLAFKEGNPVKDAQRVILVMAVAGIGYYAYNKWLASSLMLPFFARFNLPLGLDSILFFGAVLFNRTVTYPFLWYGIFGLNNKTRVANFLSWFVMLLLIFANWPLLSPEISKIRSQYANAVTAEQRAVIPNLFVSAVSGIRSLGASLGALISAKTAYAYESAQATFGFGEPKEEPKLGLALVQDSTMLKSYDISYKMPEPSFIMRITSPFPAGTEKPYIEVTNIKCEDKKSAKLKPLLQSGSTSNAITSKGVTPTEDKPVVVFYNGADGGTQVKCAFSDWESGDYAIAAEVDYRVDATAYLTTAFIRADQDEALRLKGIDPAVVNKIPPAKAEYDNVPVTLTWGPPDLTKSPASVDVSLDNKNPTNLLITVYVAKNSGWENSEIKSVNDITLTVPSGVSLVEGDSCDFESRDIINPAIDIGLQRRDSIYTVKDNKIRKGDELKFIGDADRFECGMKVSSFALSGADWAPARFDLTGSFIFTTKLKGVTFTVENSEVTTEQQLQNKCTTTSGSWSAATASAAATCDCGADKKWDDSNGCVASSTQGAP